MNVLDVASRFSLKARPLSAEPYGCGHINSTNRVTCEDGSRVILQKINTAIFQDPEGLMRNIVAVTDHIRRKNEGAPNADRCTLTVIPALDGHLCYYTEEGDCYRAYEYVENTVSLQMVENAKQFEDLAYTFGTFQNQLADFDASCLTESIPNFHNTGVRYEAFERAVEEDLAHRASSVAEEIAFAKARKADATRLTNALAAGELPLRVTHNDTKLNNVLFDQMTGEAICVIDLDTVMPGLVHYDFGDSIRFGASTAEEDEKDLSKVTMDLSLFEAFARGFLRSCGKALTQAEIDYLPFSAKLLTYECGMRFLTDYLNGDTYFKIHYPEQNLDRCHTQFKLVADMEDKMEAMQAIVRRLAEAL